MQEKNVQAIEQQTNKITFLLMSFFNYSIPNILTMRPKNAKLRTITLERI